MSIITQPPRKKMRLFNTASEACSNNVDAAMQQEWCRGRFTAATNEE